MEDKERAKRAQTRKVHPKKRSNCLLHFLFCWELRLVAKGWKRDLSEDDMYDPLKECDARRLGDKLEKLWTEEENFKKSPSLLRALVKQFGWEFFMYGLIYFPVDLAVILLQPQFLIKLLNYYSPNQKNTTTKQALLYSSVIVLLALARVLVFHWFILQLSNVGLKARIACSSLIYRRSLNLKRTTFQKVTTGQIINLLSNDVYRLDFVFAYVHFVWISPVETIVAGYFLDFTLGHAALTGIGLIVLCLLLQTYMSKQISHCRKAVALKTDYRIRLMNDIVVGIQVIKMYTWEKTFIKLVQAARQIEMKKVSQAINFRIINNSLRLLYTRLSIYICVLIMIFNSIPLTSQYIFGLINTYEFLKIPAIIYVPLGVTLFSEAKISVGRIEKFLLTEFEKPIKLVRNLPRQVTMPQIYIVKKQYDVDNFNGVSIRNLTLKWDPSLAQNTLSNVNFNANSGEVVGVIGAAGSGKSTLLQAILKEVDAQKGSIKVEGSISYASQDPWVFPASIRQNILFGQDLDPQKYAQVARVCALERDFTLFPYGDNTLVGDRGVMLSGGQKARINLARAIYRDADIYLLDDPLSAVDAHVAEQIFKECILGYLKKKCVILVTHQVHHLKNLKKLYLMKAGRIEEISGSSIQLVEADDAAAQKQLPAESSDVQSYDIPLEIKEHRSTDSASRRTYKSYCLASGSWLKSVVILIMLLLSQALGNSVEYFVAFLVNLKQEKHFYSELKALFTPENCAYIYSALIIVFICVTYTALRLLTAFCLNAAKNLHNSMLNNVIHGTMEFFNHHSAGRILNRFSKDLGCLDESIPLNLVLGGTITLMLFGICATISILNYWMIIPTIILLVFILSYAVAFQPSTKNIKRTEAITKSSVFTHTMSSLQGLPTIRAFKGQRILQTEFDNHMNLYASAYYMLIALYSTITFWTDLTCVIYVALVVFSFFIFGSKMYVGFIGLSITQSISLVGLFQYGMRTWSELDSQMTSVERVVEYAELEPEKDEGQETAPADWPKDGKIVFQAVSLQYPGSTSTVLKNVSFAVQPGEKVGVVGRTGAGKSSLISAIFRLFNFTGQILIDGIDSKTIPLNTLRSKLSIIPQDPVLFLGTLRQNVDPFDEYSDAQLWNALEEVELKAMVSNWASGLETIILEGGSNVSVGQRQLLCLVRAILKNSKIIVLDEATANVDLKTDEVIQRVIRKKFMDCTVLTIAHRLNTIMDSDKILVMDAGSVAEFGPPEVLLENPEGHFYGLVKLGGKKEKE